MNKSLDAWSETLPDYFRLDRDVVNYDSIYLFTRARLGWRFWNLKIILFRQIVLRRAMKRTESRAELGPLPAAEMDNQYRDIAVNAAHATIVSIDHFLTQQAPTRLASWYAM